MGEKTTGELSGISITAEDGYGEKVAKAVPLAGGLVKAVDNGIGAMSDGQVTGGEVAGLAVDATGFIQSCTDAASGIATDPIGWLVGQGLNFLLVVVQPLQDLIHFVSGDGPALGNAAGNFNSIAGGLVKFAQKYHQEAGTALADWTGDAKDAAQAKVDAFAQGIQGTAAEAGNIAQLLQISSMIMSVIEDFIKALLTEFITWLVMIWIPALAAAVPSFGASTAAAGTATTVKGTTTAANATQKVSKLRQLLDKIHELITKLKDFFKTAGAAIKKSFAERKLGSALHTGLKDGAQEMGVKASAGTKLYADTGMVGSRMLGGLKNDGDGGLGQSFVSSMVDAGKGSLQGQVGIGADGGFRPGKPLGHLANGKKAADYGGTGEDQSHEENTEDLNF
ncbi:WXG100 family type VII secretion target [Amycolatopsis magusensis]|uniref:WXG100 family type VII secretion target n=1 Tax=Amycolatopsis magusensis TaxID=882444 RepID=UPI003C303A28